MHDMAAACALCLGRSGALVGDSHHRGQARTGAQFDEGGQGDACDWRTAQGRRAAAQLLSEELCPRPEFKMCLATPAEGGGAAPAGALWSSHILNLGQRSASQAS